MLEEGDIFSVFMNPGNAGLEQKLIFQLTHGIINPQIN